MMKLFKRVLAVLLVISLLPAMPFVALAEEAAVTTGTSEGLTYEITDGEVTITDCDTSLSGDLVIPATIEGYPVTAIGAMAFHLCKGLTAVTIPDGVESIGRLAFWACSGLNGVTIPTSVTEIDSEVFYLASELSIYYKGTAEQWAAIGFAGLGYYTVHYGVVEGGTCGSNVNWKLDNEGTLTIFGSGAMESYAGAYGIAVSSIPWYSSRSNIKMVVIEKRITSIGTGAFYDCSKLISVNIPDSVTSIGRYAFSGCSKLTDVYYSGTEFQWAEISIESDNDSLTEATIHRDGDNVTWMLDEETGTLTISGTGSMTDYPYGNYSAIPWYENRDNITSIVICEGITEIGNFAFHNCYNLIDVTIPNGVTAIGDDAFYACYRLASVTIPDSVITIGSSAFSWCEDMTVVTIGSGVTSVGMSAFNECSSLTDVYYNGSTAQWEQITIGSYNASLTNATLHTAEPSEPVVPAGITYEITDGEVTITGCDEGLSGDLVIPATIEGYPVTRIYFAAFKNDSLTSVTIPGSVTTIEWGAFWGCDSLRSVTILEGVTTIDDQAFFSCDALTSVTIPSSVISIGSQAFYACISLNGIWVDSNNANYSSDAHGVLFNKDKTELIKAPYAISGSYIVPSSVTTIWASAFEDCDNLTSVTIPQSVTSIGEALCGGCSSLEGIFVAPGNAYYTNDQQGVLYSKDKTLLVQAPGTLSGSYSILEGVTSIGEHAFYGCGRLTSVTIPEGVTTIGEEAFIWCVGLTSVTIPEGVTTIGNLAFSDCSITCVYYGGTADQWEQITEYDAGITNATIHYAKLSELSVLTRPSKVEYWVGEELDTTGLTLSAVYSNGVNGSTQTVAEGYTVTGFDSKTAGTKTVMVSYGGKTATFSVTVKTPELTGFSILTPPDKTEYWVGEKLDTTGLVLTATYANGSTETVTEGFTVTDFNNTSAGTKTVTVTYGGKTVTFTVTVAEFPEESINAPLVFQEGSTEAYCAHCGKTVEWTALGEISSNFNLADSKHYYLPASVENTAAYVGPTGTSSAGKSTVIHLNGHNISSTERALNVNAYSDVTILGNGVVSGASTYAGDLASGRAATIYVRGNLELVGGTYTHAADSTYPTLTMARPIDKLIIRKGASFLQTDGATGRAIEIAGGRLELYGATIDGDVNLAENNMNGVLDYQVHLVLDSANITGKLTIPTKSNTAAYNFDISGATKIARLCIQEGGKVNFTELTEGADITVTSASGIFTKAASSAVAGYLTDNLIKADFTLTVGAADGFLVAERKNFNGLLCELANGEVTITGYTGNLRGELVIPATIEGYPVTSIGSEAFYDCDGLTSVTIPDSVTTIGDRAFYDCDGLTSVTIPASVTAIEEYAFCYCINLMSVYYGGTKAQWAQLEIGDMNGYLLSADLHILGLNYEIANGEVTITGYTGNLSGELVIPATIEGYPVTTIGHRAFDYCENLTSVTIPSSVTTIGDFAFDGCASLTTVTIPDSVTTIGEDAFSYCSSLTGIWVDADNANYSSDARGVLFNKDKTVLIQAPGGISGSYTVPNSVTTIGAWAFSWCRLDSVTISDSVTTIEGYAFCESSVNSLTLGKGVTTIGAWAFHFCGLDSVTIPASVTTIGDHAFYECGVNSVTFEEGVTTIWEGAFARCFNLVSVTIPSSVTTIGSSAFAGCESLSDVYYDGAASQWTQIEIGSNNEYLTNATLHMEVTELSINTLPVRQEYWVGEALDTTGLTLTATFANGITDTVAQGFTVSGFDSDTAGTQAVTVTYNDKTVSFDVTVKTPKVTEITIVTLPGKTVYWTDEELDTTGLTISATYENGDVRSIAGGYTLTGFDPNTAGEQTITVTFDGKTTSYTVTVKAPKVTEIAILTLPNKTEYLIGEAFDTTGLSLTAAYENGTTRTITEGFEIIGFSSASAGRLSVLAYYEGEVAIFSVTVKALTITGIKVDIESTKTEYWSYEELRVTDLTVTAGYSDGSTRTITEGFTVTGFAPNTAGVQTITVTYGEFTMTYEVVVRNAIVRDTLEEAIEDYVGGFDRILLEGNVNENVVLNKDVELDLNGFSIQGQITGSGKLILVDSNTDDFTVKDGEGYGKVSLEMGAHIVPGKGYVKITEADGVSVHKVKLDVKSMSLRPENAGLYFNSNFAGDEVVAEHVTGFGVALSVTGTPDETTLENSKHFTRFGKEYFGTENTSTLLTGVLKKDNGYNTNVRNARLKVYGRAYIEVDGVVTFGECQSRSLQEQIEGMDAIWDRLSASQKNGALELYNQYQKVFRGWNIPNLKNAAK